MSFQATPDAIRQADDKDGRRIDCNWSGRLKSRPAAPQANITLVLGAALREFYGDICQEALPDNLQSLVEKLEQRYAQASDPQS